MVGEASAAVRRVNTISGGLEKRNLKASLKRSRANAEKEVRVFSGGRKRGDLEMFLPRQFLPLKVVTSFLVIRVFIF